MRKRKKKLGNIREPMTGLFMFGSTIITEVKKVWR